jgi:hypothetical protein
MRIRWLLICVTLVGSGTQGRSWSPGGEFAVASLTASAMTALANSAPRSASPYVSALRYYPLRNYRRFPAPVRELLRRADMENEHCSNHTGHDADGFRACNRAWPIMLALERRGWCWGNERPSRVSADQHWLRCRSDPLYRPGYLGPHTSYTEREIREIVSEPGQ